MSGDVATLGIRIDSRDTVAAKKALDGFAGSAKSAAAAASLVEKTTKSAAQGTENIAAKTGLARHELVNLSRQVQDVGVSLASGQSPFLVLAQQGTQIADIFGSSKTATVGGAFKQIIGGIGAARLAALGFVGVVASAAIAVKNLADGAKAFDDLARSVDAARGQLSALQQAASFKGIGSEDFAKFTERFGAAVYDAKNNMGQLAEFLRANGKSATDFQGTLETVADLIKNARNDQERILLLQRNGLPATMEWMRFLSQGKDGIRAATDEAVRFNESAEGKLIASARAFDEAWNKATTSFVNRFKSGILEAVGFAQNIQIPDWLKNGAAGAARGFLTGGFAGVGVGAISGATRNPTFDERFGSFGNVGNSAGLQNGLQNRARAVNGQPATVNNNELLHNLQIEQPQLGLFGQTPTAKQVNQPKPEKESDRDSDRLGVPKAA